MMGLDEDISTAIEAQLVTDGISAIVQNTKHSKPTQVPWIYVNTDGTGPRSHADLTTFYRKEDPFNVEVRGSNDDDTDALENSVEKAIVKMTITSGWMELESATKLEVTKKYQKWIVGKKIYYEDLAI